MTRKHKKMVPIQFKAWERAFSISRNRLRDVPIPNEENIGSRAYYHFSIYLWCWRFMRLSPALMFARSRKAKPAHKPLASTLEAAGNLGITTWWAWWRRHGNVTFAERLAIPTVRVATPGLDLRSYKELWHSRQRILLVEVPLTIPTRSILRQIKQILDEEGHSRKDFDPAPFSTAPFKLHTMRYRIRNIETRFWVLLYRLLYPDVPVWVIGDRLRLAPRHKMRGLAHESSAAKRKAKAGLESITGRHLYKARYMLEHMNHGVFPNDQPIAENAGFTGLFGRKWATQYREFVLGSGTAQSEWIKRVRRDNIEALRKHVLQINLADRKGADESRARTRLDAFMRGLYDDIL